jgi:hypothetical protein
MIPTVGTAGSALAINEIDCRKRCQICGRLIGRFRRLLGPETCRREYAGINGHGVKIETRPRAE